MNEALKEKNHIPHNLEGVFIDSWATFEPDDPYQQEAYTRETAKLWDFFSTKERFEFKSMQDILDELYECKEDTKKDIEWLKQENEHRKNENEDLKTDVDSMIIAPIGTIMAWTPKPDKDTLNPASLPTGWVLCDGSKIVGGIWDGRYTPNLNGEKRFLRGGQVDDVLEIEDDTTRYTDRFYINHYEGTCGEYGAKLVKYFSEAQQSNQYDDYWCEFTGNDETRPRNMKVLWIMKIR